MPADGCPRLRGPKREAGANPAQGRCCDRPGGFTTPLRMTAGRRTPPRRAESQKTCPSGSVHVRGLGPRPRAGRSLSRRACSRRPVPNLAPPRTSPARCRREEPSPCRRTPFRLHADRTVGGDRDHRDPDRPACCPPCRRSAWPRPASRARTTSAQLGAGRPQLPRHERRTAAGLELRLVHADLHDAVLVWARHVRQLDLSGGRNRSDSGDPEQLLREQHRHREVPAGGGLPHRRDCRRFVARLCIQPSRREAEARDPADEPGVPLHRAGTAQHRTVR